MQEARDSGRGLEKENSNAPNVQQADQKGAPSDKGGRVTKPILLWAPPRSTSTAFERAVMQHPDVAVFHEQLADCFYFGADRKDKPLPPAIESSKLQRDTTYSRQVTEVLEGDEAGVKSFAFSKELSIYYQAERLPLDVMRSFTHCFLIRQPEKVLRSFLRMGSSERGSTGSSTYFDPDEMGFVELEQIYNIVTTELGQPAVVVDAADMIARPEATMRAWCEAVGLPFERCMTSWEPTEPSSWGKWPGWHNDAAGSSGFAPTQHSDASEPLSEEAQRVIDSCQPIYDHLYGARLVVA